MVADNPNFPPPPLDKPIIVNCSRLSKAITLYENHYNSLPNYDVDNYDVDKYERKLGELKTANSKKFFLFRKSHDELVNTAMDYAKRPRAYDFSELKCRLFYCTEPTIGIPQNVACMLIPFIDKEPS